MDYLIAIFPPVAVGVLFFFVMRLIFQADRRERRLLAQMESEYDSQPANEVGNSDTTESTSRE
ncbi:hypothetical protein BSZ39_11780 [Bowdeniella nasicola]|uniref:Uncharacterized protein n=1 Tax=Bowdeniella nasicola TaxID=208480 RepID=A0A1Q5PZV3_9ACTO|nr:hypothetical protein [Bowdeniella nasicola]OKL53006.1 hypothetical protein BSZ39_11780 [Bowdeniella nasicola]